MYRLLWSGLALALAAQEPLSVLQTRLVEVKPKHKEVRVNIFRHCVRATRSFAGYLDGKEVDKEKLSSVKPPEWETVPPWSHSHLACTKQGLQIIEHAAKIMAAKMPLKHVTLYANSEDRAITSAEAMLRGLFSNSTLNVWAPPADVHVKFIPGFYRLFEHEDVKRASMTKSEKAAALEAVDKLALPMGVGTLANVNLTRWKEVLHELESLIGRGPMGHLQDLLPVPSNSWTDNLMKSPLAIIVQFATQLLYSFASGVNYSNATVGQRHDWVRWHHYLREVWNVMKPDFQMRRQGCLVWKVIEDLTNAQGDSIWIGHDTSLDIFALLLQVSWEAPPYVSTSPAPPGGGLHIHRVDDFLEVSFSYAVFDGTATPDVRIVPVKPHRVRLVEFKERAKQALERWWPGSTSPAKKCRKILRNIEKAPPPSSDGVDLHAFDW